MLDTFVVSFAIFFPGFLAVQMLLVLLPPPPRTRSEWHEVLRPIIGGSLVGSLVCSIANTALYVGLT